VQNGVVLGYRLIPIIYYIVFEAVGYGSEIAEVGIGNYESVFGN
jgi:hypothetical protein